MRLFFVFIIYMLFLNSNFNYFIHVPTFFIYIAELELFQNFKLL